KIAQKHFEAGAIRLQDSERCRFLRLEAELQLLKAKREKNLWIYVPVGVVGLMAGGSVLLPLGRGLGGAAFIAAPRVARAGAFRLCATAVIFAGFLTAAYW